MTTKKQENRYPSKKLRDPDLAGADAAMLRAAKVACRRAIETTGSVAIFRDGKIVREKDIKKNFPEDSESHSS